MFAVKFQATITNGTIEIPDSYLGQLGNQVHVILLSEEARSSSPNLIDRLLEKPIGLGEFQPMTREEIYERK